MSGPGTRTRTASIFSPSRAAVTGVLLLSSDLHVEGLFRVPGNSLRQQSLKELLSAGAGVDLDSGDFRPHDVASLLKSLLGELPEPLLTHRHFHAHLKIAGRTSWGGVVGTPQAVLDLTVAAVPLQT